MPGTAVATAALGVGGELVEAAVTTDDVATTAVDTFAAVAGAGATVVDTLEVDAATVVADAAPVDDGAVVATELLAVPVDLGTILAVALVAGAVDAAPVDAEVAPTADDVPLDFVVDELVTAPAPDEFALELVVEEAVSAVDGALVVALAEALELPLLLDEVVIAGAPEEFGAVFAAVDDKLVDAVADEACAVDEPAVFVEAVPTLVSVATGSLVVGVVEVPVVEPDSVAETVVGSMVADAKRPVSLPGN